MTEPKSRRDRLAEEHATDDRLVIPFAPWMQKSFKAGYDSRDEEVTEYRLALMAVIAVADRKTKEFDLARQVLEKWKE